MDIAIGSFNVIMPGHWNLHHLWAACLAGQDLMPKPTNEAAFGAMAAGVMYQTLNFGPGIDPRRCGLILASTKGNIALNEAWLDQTIRGAAQLDQAPPDLHTDALGLANGRGLGGPVYAVSTACTSGLTALIDAALLLNFPAGVTPTDGSTGDKDGGQNSPTAMMVVAADAAGGFVCDGFRALKALAPEPCRPFDKQRRGLTLGSAAAGCLLTKGKRPGSLRLCGFGISNDATHMTAPDRAARGLTRAIDQALRMADLSPDAIDAIAAHGTGTQYNDAMEATAFAKMFSHSPAITATKPITGHTLGAAALVETALIYMMLRKQTLPPIAGLKKPEFALNFVMRSPRPMPLHYILKTSSGFGGFNAAAIFALWPEGKS